jgi:hypothetical protein
MGSNPKLLEVQILNRSKNNRVAGISKHIRFIGSILVLDYAYGGVET